MKKIERIFKGHFWRRGKLLIYFLPNGFGSEAKPFPRCKDRRKGSDKMIRTFMPIRLLPTPGTDVMNLKIFSRKHLVKKLAFLTQSTAKLCKKFIITLVFEKNAIFFAENC
jgi:hypothetical protein